jgi:uncharacterized protein (TIGR00369 family)
MEPTEYQPTSRTCFVCGRENRFGLGMRWENDRERKQVRATLTVPEHYNGYPGVVHGGIVAAMLDETAGRAIQLEGGADCLMVTLKLEVVYRRPTPTGIPLTVTGRVLQQTGTRATVEGDITLPDGTVTAQCSAVVVRPPAAIMETWSREREHWKVT